jgi:hypothetical protein
MKATPFAPALAPGANLIYARLEEAKGGIGEHPAYDVSAPSAADGPMPGGTANRGLVERVGNTVRRPSRRAAVARRNAYRQGPGKRR